MIDPADSVTLALPQPTRVQLAAGARVHHATLDQDLFGEWVLTQSWSGRNGTRGGGRLTRVVSFQAGMAMMEELVRKLGREGYRLVG